MGNEPLKEYGLIKIGGTMRFLPVAKISKEKRRRLDEKSLRRLHMRNSRIFR